MHTFARAAQIRLYETDDDKDPFIIDKQYAQMTKDMLGYTNRQAVRNRDKIDELEKNMEKKAKCLQENTDEMRNLQDIIGRVDCRSYRSEKQIDVLEGLIMKLNTKIEKLESMAENYSTWTRVTDGILHNIRVNERSSSNTICETRKDLGELSKLYAELNVKVRDLERANETENREETVSSNSSDDEYYDVDISDQRIVRVASFSRSGRLDFKVPAAADSVRVECTLGSHVYSKSSDLGPMITIVVVEKFDTFKITFEKLRTENPRSILTYHNVSY